MTPPSPRILVPALVTLGAAVGQAADPLLNASTTANGFYTLGTPSPALTMTLPYHSAWVQDDLTQTIDWANQSYNVRFPAGYNPAAPAGTYGLMTYIDSGDGGSLATNFGLALDARKYIVIAGKGIGNFQATSWRISVAAAGCLRMKQLLGNLIDSNRIFGCGQSGGGRVSSTMVQMRPDFFRGHLGWSGASMAGTIPGWEVADRNNTTADGDYETEYDLLDGANTYKYRIFSPAVRFANLTYTTDFRRAELAGIYRFGHLAQGNATRLIVRNGGHTLDDRIGWDEAIRFLEHPLVNVAQDRFEDGVLGTGADAGAATTAVVVGDATVTEEKVTVGSATCGVARLHPGTGGTAAGIVAGGAFTWNNRDGAIIDVHARPVVSAGQNQTLAIHIVPADRTGDAATAPGLHLSLAYGGAADKHRATLINAAGTATDLGTWTFNGTAPLDLAAGDKLFYHDAKGIDRDGTPVTAWAAGQKNFRGDDCRISLDDAGFQFTFSRPCANLSTAFSSANGVFLFPTDSVLTPYTDNQPYVLQGYWPQINQAAINGLTQAAWKVVVTNQAINAAAAAGDALVDEVAVTAGASLAPPAAPAALTVADATASTPTLSGSGIAGTTATIYEGTTVLARFTIGTGGTWTTTLATPLTSGRHDLTWTMTNTIGEGAASPSTRLDVNLAPVVSTGANLVLAAPGTVNLAGSATDDGVPAPASLSYRWTIASGTGATLADPASPVSALTMTQPGPVVLTLTVSDGLKQSSADLQVQVNGAPALNALADQRIAIPFSANLSAVTSDDGLPSGTLGLLWSQASGPGTLTFAAATAASTTVSADTPGTYVVRCTVDDGMATTTQTMILNVDPRNQAPVVSIADATLSRPGPLALAPVVSDDGYPFGSTLTTTWTVVSGPAPLTLSSTTTPATSTTLAQAGTYVLRLAVSDSQATTTKDVTVRLNGPPAVNAGPDQQITLPATAVLPGAVSDDNLPENRPPGILWRVVEGAAGVVFANPAAAATTATFPAAGRFVLRLSAEDGLDAVSDDLVVVVMPDPTVNHPPRIVVSGSYQARQGQAIALAGAVDDVDPIPGLPLSTSWRLVSGPGSATIGDPDRPTTPVVFPGKGTYVLRLTANDGQLQSTADVTVTVLGQDEAVVSGGSSDGGGGGGCGSGGATGLILGGLSLGLLRRKARS